MESLIQQSFLDHILELEGGYTFDQGNPTIYGISTNSYPELAEDISSQTLTIGEARGIYSRDYLKTIPGHDWLEETMPGIYWLLFTGKVHGSGDEEYTAFIQTQLVKLGYSLTVDGILGPKTLNALKNTTASERHAIFSKVLGNEKDFIAKRQRAVGRSMEGIANRVTKELKIARNYGIVQTGAFVDYQNRVANNFVPDDDWDSIVTAGYSFELRRS